MPMPSILQRDTACWALRAVREASSCSYLSTKEHQGCYEPWGRGLVGEGSQIRGWVLSGLRFERCVEGDPRPGNLGQSESAAPRTLGVG